MADHSGVWYPRTASEYNDDIATSGPYDFEYEMGLLAPLAPQLLYFGDVPSVQLDWMRPLPYGVRDWVTAMHRVK